MRKISSEKENPIDDLLIGFCDRVAPFFHATGNTPNMITTYSLISGLFALYSALNGKRYSYVIFMTMSYFLDCLDGHMARKYNQITKFGDVYDHVKDNIIVALTLFFLFRRTNQRHHLIFGAVISAGLFMMAVHMGCQQHHYGGNGDETLDALKSLCKDPTHIKYTRFFGSGTFNIGLIILVFYNLS